MDLTGKQFTKWTVISISPERNRWNCLCLCGVKRSVPYSRLLNGGSKSCGCLRKETGATNFRIAARKRALTEQEKQFRNTQSRACNCCGIVKPPNKFGVLKLQCNHCKESKREEKLSYRIGRRLKARISYALKAQCTTRIKDRTCQTLGCSIQDFILYIESLFDTGMSWENYGDWELDHIVPCSLFDLTKPEHQRRCFHFSNYQPLWYKDNIYKGARLFHQKDFLRL